MRIRSILSMLAVMLVSSATAWGGAFEPAAVPAGAKWVLHFDADSVRASALWKMMEPKFAADARYGEFVKVAQTYAGADFPRDFHGLTIYGTDFTEQSAVVLVSADVDRARVTDMLQAGAVEVPKTQGARQVFSWNDERGQHFGAFGGSYFVIARNEKFLHGAIDVLDEKSGAMKTAPGLPAANASEVLIYVAGKEIQQLAALAKNPMAQHVRDVWLTLSSTADAVEVRGVIGAADAQTATQICDLLNGVKAMVTLTSDDPKHDDATRAALQSVLSLSAVADGAGVNVDWSIPMPVVEQLIRAAQEKQAAADRGAIRMHGAEPEAKGAARE